MGETRQRFHEQLRTLEDDIQGTGGQVERLLTMALRGLSDGDVDVCGEVVKGDDEVDRRYLDVEQRIFSLFALQTPVASDLRLLTALLHINLHLERIADQAVNLAKITCMADGLPRNPQVLQGLEEMGERALEMVGTAMRALARRDLELAHGLATLDDAVDELNRGMLDHVLAAAANPGMLEWGSGCMSWPARSSGSATTPSTSASRWRSSSPGSSKSSPTPPIPSWSTLSS